MRSHNWSSTLTAVRGEGSGAASHDLFTTVCINIMSIESPSGKDRLGNCVARSYAARAGGLARYYRPISKLGLAVVTKSPDDPHIDIAVLRDRRFSVSAATAGSLKNGQLVSSHALLLEIDIRHAYCAGAWLSVIVLACAAAEAHARQIAVNNYSSPAYDLFADSKDLQWLRSIRNEIVHASEPGTPSQIWKVGGNDVGANHNALEPDATRAVDVMFRAIYGSSQRTVRT